MTPNRGVLSPCSGLKLAMYTSAFDVRVTVGRLAHHRPSVGVSGYHDRAGHAVQDAAHVLGVDVQAAQRVRCGDDGIQRLKGQGLR
jgi:hypothetical protein